MKKEWPQVRLGEVLRQVDRSGAIDASRIYRLMGVRWYGQGLFVREEKIGAEIAANRVYSVKPGDFVYNRLFAWKGSFAVAGPESHEAYVSNEFPCFLVDRTRLDPYFLLWLFREERAWTKVLALSTGATPTSRNRLKESAFLALEIPLPPLAEQRRVVARIDELAAQIHEARTLRRQASKEAEAVIGALAAVRFAECSNFQPIGTLAEIRGGIQKGPHRAPILNAVRYLTVTHVQRNRVRTDNLRFFEVSQAELERWRLLAGDVLIIEGNGSAEQIGRTALFRGEIQNCVHQNHVIRIRPDQARLDPEFLNSYLNSPVGQEAVQAQSRTTSGLRTVSVGRISQIPIAVPALPEQRRIVAELHGVQAEIDELKRLQAATAARLDSLLPSMLDLAFKGEI